MAINPYAPIELDDGREATLVKVLETGGAAVKIIGPYSRDDEMHPYEDQWIYNLKDGSWSGDYDNSCFRIRNKAMGPDRIAEMFT